MRCKCHRALSEASNTDGGGRGHRRFGCGSNPTGNRSSYECGTVMISYPSGKSLNWMQSMGEGLSLWRA